MRQKPLHLRILRPQGRELCIEVLRRCGRESNPPTSMPPNRTRVKNDDVTRKMTDFQKRAPCPVRKESARLVTNALNAHGPEASPLGTLGSLTTKAEELDRTWTFQCSSFSFLCCLLVRVFSTGPQKEPRFKVHVETRCFKACLQFQASNVASDVASYANRTVSRGPYS